MNRIKAGLMAVAVAGAFGLPATSQAINAVVFDQDGAGGGGDQIISQFTWRAGNALMSDMAAGSFSPPIILGVPGVASIAYGAGVFAGQAQLGGLVGGSLSPANLFAYEFSLPVAGSNTLLNLTAGEPGKGNSMSALSTVAGVFRMCANAVAPDEVAGTGYCQTVILSGMAFINPAVGFSLSQNANDSTLADLGTIGGANRLTDSVSLTGSTSILVDVTYQDSDYFKSDVSSLTIDLSLAKPGEDISQQVGFTAPFSADNNVNASVVGITPDYGADGLNNFYCDPAGDNVVPQDTCDVQTQTSGTTFFNHQIPEPGSIALLGLGLGIAGFGMRRRKVKG